MPSGVGIDWITSILSDTCSYHLPERRTIIADLENMAVIDVIILDTENKDLFQSNLDREKPIFS